MAKRLYPPQLDGTLPAFTGATVVVPFAMNKAVSLSEVTGFRLKIKTTLNDILINDNAPIESTNFTNSSVTFDISGISRVCQNQIVRHRIASYCVLSERYVDVSSMDCLMPVKALQADDSCIDFVRKSKEYYKKLVLADVPKEDARMFLPQGMMTNMCMHMNFRS